MWLLDANMDVHLVGLLAERGTPCRHAGQMGWNELSNGQLVRTAFAAGYRVLLTRDRLFGESAARALREFPEFAVVVVEIRQQKWERYSGEFDLRWAKSPITPRAGELVSWPVDQES